MPHVFKFTDETGGLVRISEGIRQPEELALIDDYIIGVVIDTGIYPLWSRMGNQVIVRILTAENVVMTPELHARYDRYFTPITRQLHWQNQ